MKEKLASSFSLDKLDFGGSGSLDDAAYTVALWGDAAGDVAAGDAGLFDGGAIVPIAPRERKRMREGALAESELQGGGKAEGGGAKRDRSKTGLAKPPPMHDWQFFNKARIEALFAAENAVLTRLRDINAQLKVSARRGRGRRWRRARLES